MAFGPITQKINVLQQERNQYLQQAKRDIATRRALHNSQLQSYDSELKPLKRKQWLASMKVKFQNLSQSIGKMGPM